MRAAGAMSSWGVVSMVFRPSLHMLPQEGVGGATPMPMKERKASVKMALGTAKVRVTRITPIVLGIMWRSTR